MKKSDGADPNWVEVSVPANLRSGRVDTVRRMNRLKGPSFRDNFPQRVIDKLAERAGYRCSNPAHRGQPTSGPHTDPLKSLNIGVAAHIAAAAKGGPRYDPSMDPEKRQSIGNGIWLCSNCHAIVDRDELKYTANVLRKWREDAEAYASMALTHGDLRPPPQERTVSRADRNRSAMIEKVRKIWVTGFLQQSLFHEIRILLGLSERPDAVARPLDLLIKRPDEGERPLPAGVQVVNVFDAMDHALLILGAPGSGKTTLLLELARDLLDRAVQDSAHPIPVVFPLSTWAASRKPMPEWLVDELNLRYDVPRKTGQEWVDVDQILPLLDGLDEVKPEHRAACVEAINAFRQSHGFLPLVITSRTPDYEALSEPLRLHSAILVRPLTREQVSTYLADLGSVGEPVHAALREDPWLWELLNSPLLLNIVTVSYADLTRAPVPLCGTVDERRDQLFGSYVKQMLRRRAVESRYTRRQTVQWLSWLASQMNDRGLTVFYLERLQRDWLPNKQHSAIGATYGIVFDLIYALFSGLLGGLIGGWTWALVGALVLGPVGVLHSMQDQHISPVDVVRWTWQRARSTILITAPVWGLVAGLVVGLFWALAWRSVTGFIVGGVFGIAMALCDVLTFGLNAGLTFGEINSSAVPNEGIRRSARNALFSALVFALIGGMVLGLFGGLVGERSGKIVDESFDGLYSGITGTLRGTLIGGLFGALSGTFIGGLQAGGTPCLKHVILRLWLIRNGSTPSNYVRFLDYAADHILLRRVGGGYVFIHRMLMDYFAARYVESGIGDSNPAKPSSLEGGL
jgi:eukaryotic-like serine/threonine-protein kinase